jgi:CubicO group peptidase (beta-lactamase class C family)
LKRKKHFLVVISLFLLIHGQAQSDQGKQSASQYIAPVFAEDWARDSMKEIFPVLARIYEEYAEKNKFPSITYGVVVGDQLVFSGGSGLANLETKTEATPQTVYRIASMSKSFTAMGILQLRDAGKLQLSDPVSKYIPEFRRVVPLTKDAPAITIQHLMTMSAGFPEDNPWGDRQLADTDKDLLALINEGLSLSNAPGVAFEYSNLGYALLGKIVTNVSGMPYQQYIRTNLLEPLGMMASYYDYKDVPSSLLAQGYRWEDDQWKKEPILPDGSYGAMGGLLCSLEDFAKYVSLHLNAWPPRNGPDDGPVKRSTIREMHQPWRFSGLFSDATNLRGDTCPVAVGYGYGLGWRQDCTGTIRISHSGGLPGYGSEWRFYPEYGVGVISFSNRTYGAPSPANARALDTLLTFTGLKPRALPIIPLLEKTKERIMEVLPNWEQPVDSELFAENFFLDESLEKRKKSVQKIFSDAGTLIRINQVNPENQLRGQFVIECENKDIVVFFTLTPEKIAKVQQLDVSLKDKDQAHR